MWVTKRGVHLIECIMVFWSALLFRPRSGLGHLVFKYLSRTFSATLDVKKEAVLVSEQTIINVRWGRDWVLTLE